MFLNTPCMQFDTLITCYNVMQDLILKIIVGYDIF